MFPWETFPPSFLVPDVPTSFGQSEKAKKIVKVCLHF